MRTLLVVVAAVVAALIVAAGGFALVVTFAFPRVAPASDVAIERTPECLARGRYLAENVMGCIGCHSPRMEDRYSFPAREGTEGAGGFVFSRSMGLPGNIVTKNITPHALGDWSDGEVVQAIAVGVSRDGEPLFPIMPYPGYRTLDQRDVYAVVAYLRTLAPVANDVAPRELDFPVGLMIRFVPADAAFSTRPEPSDGVAYGRYMATAGGCRECHTRIDSRGKEIGEPFAGGSEFPDPRGEELPGRPTSRRTRVPASAAGAAMNSSNASRPTPRPTTGR